VLADVKAAGKAPKPGKPESPMAAMRAAISAAMSRSKHEIPHYYLMHSVDVQLAHDWMERRMKAAARRTGF
jgi:pyruvate dehydrogenase E2 component (dihydrolipoamide acetyltransferase)